VLITTSYVLPNIRSNMPKDLHVHGCVMMQNGIVHATSFRNFIFAFMGVFYIASTLFLLSLISLISATEKESYRTIAF